MPFIAAALPCLLTSALPASATTFRWASRGDVATQDPHARDEGFPTAGYPNGFGAPFRQRVPATLGERSLSAPARAG